MGKKYKEGNEVYIKAVVHEVDPDNSYDYTVLWKDSVGGAACMLAVGEEQLATAGEISDDLASKLHEAEAKIAELKEALEKTRVRANEAESTLADYRYIFEYMPEWREHILHELCEQWRALEE